MPHSAGVEARLKSNRRAWQHFSKYKNVYIRHAQRVRLMFSDYLLVRPETRIMVIQRMILDTDPEIAGISSVNMTTDEIALLCAQMVYEHDKEPGR